MLGDMDITFQVLEHDRWDTRNMHEQEVRWRREAYGYKGACVWR